MALVQPPSTPVPAPPLNIHGLSCTGTKLGSNVNYECHRVPVECATFTRYEFEHLLKPQFWIFALIILYVIGHTYSEDAYHVFLRLLAKFRLSPRPRSRATQIFALLVYTGVLWVVWFEEYMVLSTEWRVAQKVFLAWRPSLTPLRLRLLVLYPAWAAASALCVAVMALTFATAIGITDLQMGCVKEVASIVMGRRELDARILGRVDARDDGEQGGEKDVDKMEATKTPTPLDEKSSADMGAPI